MPCKKVINNGNKSKKSNTNNNTIDSNYKSNDKEISL